MNRVMEHMASMTAIIENARSMKFFLYITFLDLANGFRSISHQLTHDMLTHIQLPPLVVQYLGDVYSKLQAFVSTPDWNTDAFASHLWVFQGDTISLITFLHCFDPLVKLSNSTLLEVMHHIFPYQIQDHCLPLIPLSICYGTWHLYQNL